MPFATPSKILLTAVSPSAIFAASVCLLVGIILATYLACKNPLHMMQIITA